MKIVQGWILISVVLFALVEFFQWAKGFMLPLPVYIMGGAFLAIASNYEKGLGSLFNQFSPKQEITSQTATLVDSVAVLEAEKEENY